MGVGILLGKPFRVWDLGFRVVDSRLRIDGPMAARLHHIWAFFGILHKQIRIARGFGVLMQGSTGLILTNAHIATPKH